MDNELDILEAEGITEEQLAAIKSGEMEEPPFPHMIFFAALTKDIIDVIEALGVVTVGIIGMIINIFMVPLIYNYVNQNLSLSKKLIYKRLIGKAVVEFVPYLEAFSFWSFFVWRAHKNEKKKMEKVLNLMQSETESKVAYRRTA